MEKAMAPHSSTLAWKIPWTEEPGALQSMGSLEVGHDWATSLSLFTFMHWRRKWQPTPVFLSAESQGRGSWWAALYGVTQSRTRLKQLSRSSSSRTLQWLFVLLCAHINLRWGNKVILYTTENYIPYPWIKHNGKEYKKECMYVFKWATLLYSRN